MLVFQESFGLIYPYFLMINGDREATTNAWKAAVPIDRSVIYPSTPIPEILAADYTYAALRKATDNFRSPAVVR
jgi:hypothetical protein